ncbi:MAG: ABC transporter substrate-binding protein [Alkalilacustris sp.]
MKHIAKLSAAGALAVTLAAPLALSAETLRWVAARDILSLDPYSFGDTFTIAVMNHVYEGLVRYDENLEIEPALATEWSVADDNVTWTFRLREGVTFHNGAPFTAHDVVASLARVSHETSPLRGNLPAYQSSRAIDDHTVEIVVNTTYPLLLNDLTNIMIFNRDWLVENNAELPTDAAAGIEGFPTNNANGTGPFIVESRQPDARTVFVVNPDWWDEPQHNLTRIDFQPVASAATRVAALISGEVDFVNAVPLQDIPRLEAAPDVNVLASSDLRTLFFAFNMKDEPFSAAVDGVNPFQDIRVREAINLAIDGDLIHSRVMRGLSRPTGSLVAPAIPGYSEALDERLPFDPARARELLAEAGFADGFSFTLLCSNDGLVNEEDICQAAGSMLARVGLDVNLEILPSSLMRPRRSAGEFDMVIMGWANEPMIDAYSILLQVFRSPSAAKGVFNFGDWGHPEIDRLTDAAAEELDRPTRIALMNQALQVAKDEMLYVPLHQQPMVWATSSRVESKLQLPDNKPRLWETVVTGAGQ